MGASEHREEHQHEQPAGDPSDRVRERRSHVQQPLDPQRTERRHDEVRDEPQATGVVQVHVAERQREHDRTEPSGAHDQGEGEQVREARERDERADEVSPPRVAESERDAEQDDGPDVGARRRGEPQRPPGPDPVVGDRAIELAGASREGPLERPVPVAEARGVDRIESREPDRDVREGQEQEEPGGEQHGVPAGARTAPDLAERPRDDVRERESRRHHEAVRQVRGRHLTPRERRERHPSEPSPSRGHEGARRPDQDERRPRQCAGERETDRQGGRRDRHRDGEPAGGRGDPPQPLLAQEPAQPETGQDRVQDHDRAHPAPAAEHPGQQHRRQGEPPALRVGGERRSGHLERVPQGHAPVGQRAPEQARAREPERQEIGVLVGEARQERDPTKGQQDHDHDERRPGRGHEEPACGGGFGVVRGLGGARSPRRRSHRPRLSERPSFRTRRSSAKLRPRRPPDRLDP